MNFINFGIHFGEEAAIAAEYSKTLDMVIMGWPAAITAEETGSRLSICKASIHTDTQIVN